jgi:hypothetical protein
MAEPNPKTKSALDEAKLVADVEKVLKDALQACPEQPGAENRARALIRGAMVPKPARTPAPCTWIVGNAVLAARGCRFRCRRPLYPRSHGFTSPCFLRVPAHGPAAGPMAESRGSTEATAGR